MLLPDTDILFYQTYGGSNQTSKLNTIGKLMLMKDEGRI